MFEQLFGLLKDSSMADVVHVKHAVSIDSDRVVGIRAVWHSWPHHRIIIFGQSVGKILDLFFLHLLSDLVIAAGVALSSFLGAVAGLSFTA